MDFNYLLDLAKKNEEYAKEAIKVKRYSTQVSAAKKLERNAVQSESIRKFLAKKELEEKQKKDSDKMKKEKLLSLRAQDRKSNARVKAMLGRTKAANKSVLDEARNTLNTAVTSTGIDQPDEDDYGYVSHEASELYKKLLDKYSSKTDIDPSTKYKMKTKSELNNAKERVKDALHKIEAEESSGSVRKRRTTKAKHIDDNLVAELKSNKPQTFKKVDKSSNNKSRPKAAASAPALSFEEIMKLAATKQHEPIKTEKKVEAVVKSCTDNERLMTKKEREEYQRKKEEERERQLRKEGKLPPLNVAKSTVSAQPTTSKDKSQPKPVNGKGTAKADVKPDVKAAVKSAISNGPVRSSGSLDTAAAAAAVASRKVNGSSQPKTLPPSKTIPTANRMEPATTKNRAAEAPASRPHPFERPRGIPNKGKALAPGGSRPGHPYREDRPYDNPYKRRLESDDEEHDSELDDFIDDGPEESNDYSKYIKEIFNYDRSSYRNRIESDEEECMESNFAQQMNEERISTKIGILEDLEEERLQRREELMKKKLLKKRTKN